MTIAVWSGIPILGHQGCRIHYLLPAALGKLGHKVFYYPEKPDPFPEYLAWDILPHLQPVTLEGFMDCLPVDVFLYIDSTPSVYVIRGKTVPNWEEIRKKVSAFVYVCVDYWEGWLRNVMSLNVVSDEEAKIVDLSTHITAISPQLCVHLAKRYGKPVFWLPNAAPPFFQPCGGNKASRDKIALIVGAPWYRNWEGMKRLASLFPDWDFFWVGGLLPPQFLGSLPSGNFFMLEEKPPQSVMQIATFSLVGIVPTVGNWFNYFSDPLKWYIYHACGLPVVSVGVQHHMKYPKFYPNTWAGTDLVSTFKEFLQSLPDLEYPLNPLPVHTYEHRAKALLDALEGKITYGRAEPDGTFIIGGVVSD